MPVPADFLELLNSTAQWRGTPQHGVGAYTGPWIENVWVNDPSVLEEVPEGAWMFCYGMNLHAWLRDHASPQPHRDWQLAISILHHPSEPDQPLEPTPETRSYQRTATVAERIQFCRGCRCTVCWAVLALSFMTHDGPWSPEKTCSCSRSSLGTHRCCRVVRMLRLTRPADVQGCRSARNNTRRRSAHSLRKQTRSNNTFEQC